MAADGSISKILWSAGLVLTGAIVFAPLLWRSFVSLDSEEEGLLESDKEIARAFFSFSDPATSSSEHETQQSDANAPTAVAYDESTKAYHWQRRLVGPRLRSTELPSNLSFWQKLFQKKEFLWTSVNDDRYHLGVALLQFHYVGVVVINFFDVKSQQSWKEKIEIPLAECFGIGPEFTTTRGNSVEPLYRAVFLHPSLGAEVELTYSATALRIQLRRCRVTQTTSNEPWSLDVDVTVAVPTHLMQMVFPIGRRRASVVTKFAGAPLLPLLPPPQQATSSDGPNCGDVTKTPARQGFRLIPPSSSSGGDVDAVPWREFGTAFGAIDFTRGLLRRTTVWYWTCVSGTVYHSSHASRNHRATSDGISEEGAPSHPARISFGMHLSAKTYDVQNASMESVVFLGPDAFFVNKQVLFEQLHDETVAATAVQQLSWRIQTNNERTFYPSPLQGGVENGDQRSSVSPPTTHDVEIDVTFRPVDLHDGRFNYLVFYGALMHYWGTYTGRVTVDGEVYEVRGLPGVMEDHFAVW